MGMPIMIDESFKFIQFSWFVVVSYRFLHGHPNKFNLIYIRTSWRCRPPVYAFLSKVPLGPATGGHCLGTVCEPKEKQLCMKGSSAASKIVV